VSQWLAAAAAGVEQFRWIGYCVCVYISFKTDLSAIGFKQKDIFTSSISTVPPWLLKPPSVDLSLSIFAEAETIPEVFKSKFLEICDRLQGFSQIYTDGSKTNNGTAAAAVSGDIVKSLRINSHASIFTAELVAVNVLLLWSIFCLNATF